MSLKKFGEKTILIVEDDAFNNQLIRSLLERISVMNLISSYDGQGALKRIEEANGGIDMVLLDIRMPIMNGEDVLKTIRADERYNDMPVLIISVDKGNETNLRGMGANDFILKPFNIDDLASKIEANLTIEA